MSFKKMLFALVMLSSVLVACSANTTTTSQSTASSVASQASSASVSQQTEEKPLPKISVASVAIAQVLDALEVDVVGKPKTKMELPQRYANVPEIGSSFSPDFEQLLATGTELLIADEMFKNKMEESAKEYRIDTFYVNTSTYEKFIETLTALGEKINRVEKMSKIIDDIKAPIKKYEEKETDKTVAIIFGTSESNQLATEDSYVGSLVKAMGAKNIVDEIKEKDQSILSTAQNGYVNLNIEQILLAQPDIIIRFGHGNVQQANESFEKLFQENPAWKTLNAVKENKIYDLDANLFGSSANLKISQALDKLGAILYEN